VSPFVSYEENESHAVKQLKNNDFKTIVSSFVNNTPDTFVANGQSSHGQLFNDGHYYAWHLLPMGKVPIAPA
jgi:hypothetical protein